MEIIHINGKDDFNKNVLESKGLVLCDFFATWCMPCKMLGNVLEQFESNDDFQIVKVDIDENEDLAREYGVMSVPTIFVFKDGNQVEKLVGFRQANEIEELTNSYK